MKFKIAGEGFALVIENENDRAYIESFVGKTYVAGTVKSRMPYSTNPEIYFTLKDDHNP